MTRLPNPGADSGTWGGILNEFLEVEHNSDGTLKQSAVISNAEQSSQKGQPGGYAPLDGSGQVPIANLPSQVVNDRSSVYPLSEYGLVSATTHPDTINASSSLALHHLARIFIPAGTAINRVSTVVASAGTVGGGGDNCFTIYGEDGVLLGNTPMDNNLWALDGWVTADLITPIAASPNDRTLFVGTFMHGYAAAPNIHFNRSSPALMKLGYNKPNHVRTIYSNNPSTVPSTVNFADYIAMEWLPFIGIS